MTDLQKKRNKLYERIYNQGLYVHELKAAGYTRQDLTDLLDFLKDVQAFVYDPKARVSAGRELVYRIDDLEDMVRLWKDDDQRSSH